MQKRVNFAEKFWTIIINDLGEIKVVWDVDDRYPQHYIMYNSGNYFLIEEEAIKVMDEIKEIFNRI